ncbi:hypothetical protein Tco_0405303 [Tanacetum coccineum]
MDLVHHVLTDMESRELTSPKSKRCLKKTPKSVHGKGITNPLMARWFAKNHMVFNITNVSSTEIMKWLCSGPTGNASDLDGQRS